MGRGNTRILGNYTESGSRERVSTYNIDYGDDFDSIKEFLWDEKRERKGKQDCKPPKDEKVWDYINDNSQRNFIDCVSNLQYIVKQIGFDIVPLRESRQTDAGQTILADGEYSYLVGDDNDGHEISIGFVMKIEESDAEQEIWDEHGQKEDWYRARNKCFSSRIDELTEQRMEWYAKRYRKEANEAMRLIHEAYPKSIGFPVGAWCGGTLEEPALVAADSYYG